MTTTLAAPDPGSLDARSEHHAHVPPVRPLAHHHHQHQHQHPMMEHADRVAEILTEVGVRAGPVEGTPRRLVAACLDAVPVTGVGWIIMGDLGPEVLLAATDGHATTLENLQFSLGEGPCVDSVISGTPQLHPRLRETGPERWPIFAQAALETGVAAIFAFPIKSGPVTVGVLDLYRDDEGDLPAASLAEAGAFAAAAAAVLIDPPGSLAVLHPDLRAALDDRAEVHQATGMVSVQAGVTLSEALMLLQARAFAEESSVLAVATRVLRHQLRFTER